VPVQTKTEKDALPETIFQIPNNEQVQKPSDLKYAPSSEPFITKYLIRTQLSQDILHFMQPTTYVQDIHSFHGYHQQSAQAGDLSIVILLPNNLLRFKLQFIYIAQVLLTNTKIIEEENKPLLVNTH
jgi:hypothetical protein